MTAKRNFSLKEKCLTSSLMVFAAFIFSGTEFHKLGFTESNGREMHRRGCDREYSLM